MKTAGYGKFAAVVRAARGWRGALFLICALAGAVHVRADDVWKDITSSLRKGHNLLPNNVNRITDNGTDLQEGRLKQNNPYLYKVGAVITDDETLSPIKVAAVKSSYEKETVSATGTARKVVVLVRGYGKPDSKYWKAMTGYLTATNEGFDVWDATGSLDGHASVADNAGKLSAYIAAKVRSIQPQTSVPKRLSILAHSMGGQTTRAYLALNGGRPQIPVDCVIMFSPTLCGSWIADDVIAKRKDTSLFGLGSCTWGSTIDVSISGTLAFNATHRYLPGISSGTKYYTVAGIDHGALGSFSKTIESSIRRNCPEDEEASPVELMNDGMVTRSSSWGEAGRAEANYVRAKGAMQKLSVVGFTGKFFAQNDHLNIIKDENVYTTYVKPLLLGASQQSSQAASIRSTSAMRLTTASELPAVPAVMVATYSGTLASEATFAHTVAIDATSEAQFFLSASTNAVSFTLQTPSGAIITPEDANGNAAIRYEEDEGSSCYSISNPASGPWTMTVSCADVGTNEVDCMVAVFEKSPLSFTVERDLAFVRTNASVTILGRLTDADGGVTGAAVGGSVYAPDGSTNAAVLSDDGLHGDGAAGDGVYGVQFTCTQQVGIYGINLTAHGTKPGGEAFEREGLGQTTFTAFSPIAEFTSVYADYGFDLAPTNGLIDEFVIEVGVRVKEAGAFTVAGTLVGTNGVEITSATTEVEATGTGVQTVLLRFDAPTIYDSGVLGGFDLRDLVLYGTGNNCALLDNRITACATAGYEYYQFERADKDGDGISDLAEEKRGTDPENGDTDFDGMPDKWEIDHGLDPLADDMAADADSDGMSNYEEFLAGTYPQDRNSSLSITSMGGLVQYQNASYLSFKFQSVQGKAYVVQSAEAVTGGWSTVSLPFVAVSNSTQVLVQKLPMRKAAFYRIALTEGSGILSTYAMGYDLPDQWLQSFNWDALPEPNRSQRNAADDPDGDGMSNQAERAAGTDPCDPASVLCMLSFEVRTPTSGVGGQFSSVPGREYWVETTTNLSQSWKPVTGLLRSSEFLTAWDATHTDTACSAFFRVMVVEPTSMVIWK